MVKNVKSELTQGIETIQNKFSQYSALYIYLPKTNAENRKIKQSIVKLFMVKLDVFRCLLNNQVMKWTTHPPFIQFLKSHYWVLKRCLYSIYFSRRKSFVCRIKRSSYKQRRFQIQYYFTMVFSSKYLNFSENHSLVIKCRWTNSLTLSAKEIK